MVDLDTTDRKLLNILQSDFPLVEDPFAAVGEQIGLDGSETRARTQRLHDRGIIRQISAIFDSRQLGYQSTLIAMEVPPERLDGVAAVVSQHPGVSHNYGRNHRFNLWFTMTVGPDVDLGQALADLAGRTAVETYRILPAIVTFKIGVNFDMGEGDAGLGGGSGFAGPAKVVTEDGKKDLSDADKQMVRELQNDLPIVERPFASMARRMGLSESELLGRAGELRQGGVMRRYSAVLRHRKAGFAANAMGCWVVPADRVAEVGPVMASFREVSHCYQRPTYPDWPYSLFTMIHGKSPEECSQVAAAIAGETNIQDYALLYSTKEYKKSRVKYFEEV